MNLSGRATPATRVRLVYRINAGGIYGATGAQQAADRIRLAWQSPGLPAYAVTAPTTPAAGGAPGAGVIGLITAAAGRHDYFTALDIKTDVTVPAVTWADLFAPVNSIDLPLPLSLDVSATLQSADLVTGSTASPAAQDAAARGAASSSSTSSSLSATGRVALAVGIVAAVVILGVVAYKARRA